MKLKTFYITGSMVLALLTGACQKSAKLSIEMPDLPDGTEVAVITYADSATVIKGMTGGGKQSMEITAEEGTLTELEEDGKKEAFYVVEGGEAVIKNDAESIEGDAGENGQQGEIIVRTTAPASVEVVDNGPGISKETEAKLFSPFFSTKPNGQGIGLVFIREVLSRHGCTFSLRTYNDGLTRFRILFN